MFDDTGEILRLQSLTALSLKMTGGGDAIRIAFKIKLIIHTKFHTILSFQSIYSVESLSAMEAICFRYIFFDSIEINS